MAGSDGRDSWQETGSDEFDQERLITLEFEIVGSHVPIWRQAVVPADYPLDELHFVIALLFDWSGECPYCFVSSPNVYEYPKGDSARIALPRKTSLRRLDSTLSVVADLLPAEGSAVDYYYDATELARDVWHLAIRHVGELRGAEYPFSLVPVCIDGEGNNPPEDVGGVTGYFKLCCDLADENAPGHKSASSWLGIEDGCDYEPECFDLEGANYLLARDQVDAMEGELVPNDPARLRELVKDMLAEEAVREATDILRISHLIERMSTPAGQRAIQMLLAEEFPDDVPLADFDLSSLGGSRGAGSGSARFSSLHFREEEPAARGHIVSVNPDAEGKGAAAAPAAPRKQASGAFVAYSAEALHGQPRDRDRELQPNAYLDAFEARLKEDGLSQKTIKKHVANAEYFLNVYLPDNGLSVREGCYRMDDYFGFYLPQHSPWMTLSSMKDNIASIKRLYRFFIVEGVVGMEDQKFMIDSIREFKDEWLAGF